MKILEEDGYGTFPGINVGTWLEQNVPDINRPRHLTFRLQQVHLQQIEPFIELLQDTHTHTTDWHTFFSP